MWKKNQIFCGDEKGNMKKFYYTLTFSPYMNFVRARSKKDAWKRIKKLWPEYNVEKVVSL
jgi:ABC-type metal ion transport system substrate-binding protein